MNGNSYWPLSLPIAICLPREPQLYQQLRDSSVIPQGGADGQTVVDQLAAWNQNVSARENVVLAMALSPVPSTVVFPPYRTTAELQKLLAPGEALVVFHEAAGNLYGFLLSKADSHVWQLENDKQIERGVTDILRVLGNFGPNREMGVVDLKEDKWPDAAAKAYGAIFGDARLDLSKTTSLVIVPDSWLWYMPFEMLVTQGGKPGSLLADRVPLHYGPTAALAIGDAPVRSADRSTPALSPTKSVPKHSSRLKRQSKGRCSLRPRSRSLATCSHRFWMSLSSSTTSSSTAIAHTAGHRFPSRAAKRPIRLPPGWGCRTKGRNASCLPAFHRRPRTGSRFRAATKALARRPEAKCLKPHAR